MKEAFEKLKERLEEESKFSVSLLNGKTDRYVAGVCDTNKKAIQIVSEVEAEYTKNIMDELLEAKKNCGEDSDCSQCVFGCEDGCRLQELQITGGNNGWIPCSERLPDKENVLCYAVSLARNPDTIFVGAYRNGVWFLQSAIATISYPTQYKVTAWMPLPEPWKGE